MGYIYGMTLSVIIVNYNVKLLLEQCLLSVMIASANTVTEILVVDNDSADGSVDYLQPLFPTVNFIRNTHNEGFSKANNQALALARGKYILFLNPDTEVPQDCFEQCISFLEIHPDAGALGVKMVDENGTFLKESKRGFPSPMVSLYKLTGITAMFPRSRYFAAYYLGHLDENQSHKVEVLSGAFMWIKKEALDKTGEFDERFFMYAEDIDLSYRLVQAGYANYYFSGTTILHYKGKSTRKDFKYVKLFYLAMSQFAKKHYGNSLFTALLDAGIWARAGVEIIKKSIMKK